MLALVRPWIQATHLQTLWCVCVFGERTYFFAVHAEGGTDVKHIAAASGLCDSKNS